MKKYSCWSWGYSKRYYITHPWKWFKDLGYNIRSAIMRARYGFSYGDIWNWDHWFLHTTPNMLRYMAQHGSAYPGHPPFMKPEHWHDWLEEIAHLLETGTEEWQDEHNEYYEEYMEDLKNKWSPSFKDADGNVHRAPPLRTELDDKYFARATELSKQGELNVRRAVSSIAEHYFDIWD